MNIDSYEEDDGRCWAGVDISNLQTIRLDSNQYPTLQPTDDHKILVRLPIITGDIPESYPCMFGAEDKWDNDHVKLPCSNENIKITKVKRWDCIKSALTRRISNYEELESAMLSYVVLQERDKLWSLRSYFRTCYDEDETSYAQFFNSLLPRIIALALCLPEIITTGIPLLKRGYKRSITMSQLQISCLLANAFLCTFPMRPKNEPNKYPEINFIRLFQCNSSFVRSSVHEKIKCILNYFRRVTSFVPTGVVTFSRHNIPKNQQPDWADSTANLTKLYVSSVGTIEDDGQLFCQIDFANKYVGGGFIGKGCVQEEIRFAICPELIVSQFFSECLADNEALIVIGCERFNKYKNYGWNFEWAGDYMDSSPRDEYSRIYCTVIAIDATYYGNGQVNDQYCIDDMRRELNKAYAGFSFGYRRKKDRLTAVATGNWGCGAFGGNVELKSLIQLLASAEAGRDIAYFTFGNRQLCNELANVYDFFVDNNVTVGRIWELLCEYAKKKLYLNSSVKLFQFIRQEAVLDCCVSDQLKNFDSDVEVENNVVQDDEIQLMQSPVLKNKSEQKHGSSQKLPSLVKRRLFYSKFNTVNGEVCNDQNELIQLPGLSINGGDNETWDSPRRNSINGDDPFHGLENMKKQLRLNNEGKSIDFNIIEITPDILAKGFTTCEEYEETNVNSCVRTTSECGDVVGHENSVHVKNKNEEEIVHSRSPLGAFGNGAMNGSLPQALVSEFDDELDNAPNIDDEKVEKFPREEEKHSDSENNLEFNFAMPYDALSSELSKKTEIMSPVEVPVEKKLHSTNGIANDDINTHILSSDNTAVDAAESPKINGKRSNVYGGEQNGKKGRFSIELEQKTEKIPKTHGVKFSRKTTSIVKNDYPLKRRKIYDYFPTSNKSNI